MIEISWNDYITAIVELAGIVKNKDFKPDYILTINRGGLVIGLIFSHQLHLPLLVWDMERRNDLPAIKNKKILVCDDISDTGKTFETVTKSLIENFEVRDRDISTVAMHMKPKTRYVPDIVYEEVVEWVSYPYEVDIYDSKKAYNKGVK